MDENFEHMVDVTMDAALTVAEMNHFGRSDEQVDTLRGFCAEINSYFGFSDSELSSLRKHQLNKLLRDVYPPNEGEHTTFYDPYPRALGEFRAFESFVESGAEPERAKDYCLLLNQLFLGAWSARMPLRRRMA